MGVVLERGQKSLIMAGLDFSYLYFFYRI